MTLGTALTVHDIISNRLIGNLLLINEKADILIFESDEMTLKGLKVNVIYRIACKDSDEAYQAIVVLTKGTRVAMKIKETLCNGREQRKYLRVPFNFGTKLTTNGKTYDIKVEELSYAAIKFHGLVPLKKGQQVSIVIRDIDKSEAFQCTMHWVKAEDEDQKDDPWYEGPQAVALISETDLQNQAKMNTLYAKINRKLINAENQ